MWIPLQDVNEASQLEISKITMRAVRFLKGLQTSISLSTSIVHARRFGVTRQLSVLIRNNYQSINSFMRNLFVECERCVAFPPSTISRLIDFLISLHLCRRKSEFYLTSITRHHSSLIQLFFSGPAGLDHIKCEVNYFIIYFWCLNANGNGKSDFFLTFRSRCRRRYDGAKRSMRKGKLNVMTVDSINITWKSPLN